MKQRIVPSSVLVTTSKAPVTTSDALVTSSEHCEPLTCPVLKNDPLRKCSREKTDTCSQSGTETSRHCETVEGTRTISCRARFYYQAEIALKNPCCMKSSWVSRETMDKKKTCTCKEQ